MKMRWIVFALYGFLVLVLFSLKAAAQPYYFRHYQVENGLSNNTVFCSVQDKTGFLWFGTKDGLNRFDGYRFKVFHTNADDENNLSIDAIFSLVVDATGTLWAGTQKGLYYFDAQREKLIRFSDTLAGVGNLVTDKTGQLWFTAGYRIHCYNVQQKKFVALPALGSQAANAICQLPDGRMCFALLNGHLALLERDGKHLATYDVFAYSPVPASRWISKVVAGTNANVYIGTSSQGLKEFDLRTLTYTDVLSFNADKSAVYVRDIIPFTPTEFWLATESGIFILNTQTGTFTNLKKKYLDPYSLSDNAVYTLFKDNQGGIWAGTFFGGLNYLHRQRLTFQKYFPDYSKNSISGSAVREICGDGMGNVWIGTEDAGLNKLNLKTGAISQFSPNGSPTSIDYSNIHGLLVHGNQLWVGTFEHGLDIMDIASGKVIEHYKAGPGPFDLKSNFIVTFLKTRRGEIYIGTSNSLSKWSGQKGKFLPVENLTGNAFISCLLEDSKGTVWAGTNDNGLYFFNLVSGERGRLLNEPDNKNSLTTNSINSIYEDSFQNLWLAMEGGGLCRVSKTRKEVKRYTTANGLPSNVVFKVLEDNKKNLWATTTKGLVKLDVLHNRTTVYTKANGLLNDQFNYNSGYRDSAGRLYFGSVRGMITFRPDEFYQSKFAPPVYITGLQIHNNEIDLNKDSSVLKKSIVHTTNITLNHDQSSISIDFAALSFASPEVTAYSYLMEGVDREWTHLKSNRKVYFTNLRPGTYTFKVRAAANGIWSEEKKLTIHITPPWWATWWAYAAYFLIAASLLYYIIRTYHKIHVNQKEKDLYEAKIEFFTNIAHEIKTPLTLIKGPVENLSELTADIPAIEEDVVTMERNTARLINLVNQILDFRQTETKGFSLDFSPVPIKELLQEAYLTFKPIAKKKNLSYAIELPPMPLSIMADDEALTKIFSNLFSNAVKYAEKEVRITLIAPAKDDKFLQLEFRNDGYLIPAEMSEKIFEPFYRLKQSVREKGTGIGLALARSLVELHSGQLFLKTGEEGLNVFILRLPYVYQRGPVVIRTQYQQK